jgi:hypothetical protein
MLGQLKTRMLVLSTIVVLSGGVSSQDKSVIALAGYDMCTCQTAQQSNTQACKQQAHVNWYSWLMGESSSAQFHYLDLLELLLGSDDDEQVSFTPRF